jgi:hypothetical protein
VELLPIGLNGTPPGSDYVEISVREIGIGGWHGAGHLGEFSAGIRRCSCTIRGVKPQIYGLTLLEAVTAHEDDRSNGSGIGIQVNRRRPWKRAG